MARRMCLDHDCRPARHLSPFWHATNEQRDLIPSVLSKPLRIDIGCRPYSALERENDALSQIYDSGDREDPSIAGQTPPKS